MKRSTVSLVFNIFLGIGILMLAITAVICYQIKKFEASAIRTTGTVIDLIERSSSSGSSRSHTYTPVITYTDQQEIKHRYIPSFSSNPPAYQPGESIGIYYDPAHPDDARVTGWGEYIGAIITGGLGLVFGLIGLIYHMVRKLKRSRNNQLKQSGYLIRAEVLSVDINHTVSVNRRHPFFLRCEGKDPLTGATHAFKSGFIWSDPTPFIERQKKIDVYLDPKNPRKYYVDLSFLGEQ